MENWIVKIEGENKTIGKFNTLEKGIDCALRAILEKHPCITQIFNDTLAKNTNKKTCSAIIRAFLDFTKIGNSNIPSLISTFCEAKGISRFGGVDFKTRIEPDYSSPLFYEFHFGDNELKVETNIWSPNDDESSYFIHITTQTDNIKFYINKTISEIANIYLVYKVLSEKHQARADILATIRTKFGLASNGYDIDLSEDTISNQIHALQKLGIPIYEKRINENAILLALLSQ